MFALSVVNAWDRRLKNLFVVGLLALPTLVGVACIQVQREPDTVSASDRGADLQTSVIFLTLRYRDGDEPGRITFQLTPQALSQLRGFMGRFQE